MTAGLVLALVALALLALPAAAPAYYVLLMLPFMAYAVVLLGLNLLFGYTGLVSFGHALFIGIGAYAGAVLTTHTAVRSLEVILIAAGVLGAVVAAPVGALCVRYVKIYFGMLTLAFGMLFYTFLLKFYRLTGGDEGMRVLRPSLLGLDLGALPKTDYLAGPYYYYSLGSSPWRPSSCGASCTRPSASASGPCATIPPRPRRSGSASRAIAGTPSSSRRCTPRWAARSSARPPATSTPRSPTGRSPATSSS